MAVTVATTSLNEALDEAVDETKEWHQMNKTCRFQRKKTENQRTRKKRIYIWVITAKCTTIAATAAYGVHTTLREYNIKIIMPKELK